MFTQVNTSFINWLNNLLAEKGWTQAELSKRAQISPAMISSVLSGSRDPGMNFCNSVATALKLPPEEVYRVAGLLPEEPPDDQTLYRIQNLYHTLRDADHKKKALEFMQFLSDLEDKDDRKGKKTKRD